MLLYNNTMYTHGTVTQGLAILTSDVLRSDSIGRAHISCAWCPLSKGSGNFWSPAATRDGTARKEGLDEEHFERWWKGWENGRQQVGQHSSKLHGDGGSRRELDDAKMDCVACVCAGC
jgi:hypothetical protein